MLLSHTLTEMCYRRRCFALVDAAQSAKVFPYLLHSGMEYRCLYQGDSEEEMKLYSPYILKFEPDVDHISEFLCQFVMRQIGVFVFSQASLSDLRQHFRRQLIVELPKGEKAFFRFYDPRILRVFLPTLEPKDVPQFFGPVREFLMSDTESHGLTRMSRRLADRVVVSQLGLN